MACLLLILVLAFPRLVLILMFLFTNYLNQAYHGLIVPILGFIFLPLTTIAYAWLWHARIAVADPAGAIIMILAVLIDLGGFGGGVWHRRRW